MHFQTICVIFFQQKSYRFHCEQYHLVLIIKRSPQNGFFWKILGFCPNQVTSPRPPSPNVRTPKTSSFLAILSIFFSWTNLCMMCFITFMDSSKANLVLEKNNKNLGVADTPPPWLGHNSKYLQRSVMRASVKRCVFITLLLNIFPRYLCWVEEFKTNLPRCPWRNCKFKFRITL